MKEPITKATAISIGLVIMFITASAFGGFQYAKLSGVVDAHIQQSVHPGVIEHYVSKNEMELELRLLRQEITSSGKALQREINRLVISIDKLERKIE